MMPEGLAPNPTPKPKYTDSQFFLIVLACTSLFVVFLSWVVPLHFSTVDDVEMEGIVSGMLTGQPEFRMIFSHAFLGKILAGLYQIMPGVSWYGYFFLLCHAFALSLMITMARTVTPTAGICMTALGFTIHFYCFTDLQFTTTACLLGAWATVWLWKLATRPNYSLGDGMWLVAFAGLFMAWMMRREAVAFECVALAPMFLLVFARAKNTWLPRLTIPVLVVATLLASSFIDQKMQYDTPEWQQFQAYNMRRSLTQDLANFHYGNFSKEAAQVGWTKADFNLYDEFMADGKAPFDATHQEALFNAAKPRFSESVNWQGIQTTFGDLFQYYRYLLLVVVLIAVVAFLAGKRAWYMWAVPVITLVLVMIQGHFFSSKDRLIVSAITQIGVACVAFLAVYGESIILLVDRRGKAMLFGFLALAASGFTARTSLLNARLRHDDIGRQLAAFEERVNVNANGRAIVNVDCYPALINDPFKLYAKPTAGTQAHIVPLGWFATSPYQHALLKKAGLNPDSSVFLQLFGTNKRLFLGTDAQAGMVKTFMQEHGYPDADTLSIGPFPYYRGNKLHMYRFGMLRK